MDDEWRSYAHCLGIDPDIFYPHIEIESTEGTIICASCPVQTECLNYAISANEKFGTWGGLSEWERRRRKRRVYNSRRNKSFIEIGANGNRTQVQSN